MDGSSIVVYGADDSKKDNVRHDSVTQCHCGNVIESQWSVVCVPTFHLLRKVCRDLYVRRASKKFQDNVTKSRVEPRGAGRLFFVYAKRRRHVTHPHRWLPPTGGPATLLALHRCSRPLPLGPVATGTRNLKSAIDRSAHQPLPPPPLARQQ